MVRPSLRTVPRGLLRGGAVALAALVVRDALRLWRHVRIGMSLAADARPWSAAPAAPRLRILIAGDSSAVGTGASRPEHTVAGRLARRFPGAAITNLGRNGLRTRDLLPVLASVTGPQADLLLIHAGANDIVRLTPLRELEADVAAVLAAAAPLARHVVLLTGGNLGLSPVVPPPVGWLLAVRTRAVRRIFMRASSNAGALYADMFDGRTDRPFTANPARYYARDRLHPNDEGYGLWYDAIVSTLERAGVRLADGSGPQRSAATGPRADAPAADSGAA